MNVESHRYGTTFLKTAFRDGLRAAISPALPLTGPCYFVMTHLIPEPPKCGRGRVGRLQARSLFSEKNERLILILTGGPL